MVNIRDRLKLCGVALLIVALFIGGIYLWVGMPDFEFSQPRRPQSPPRPEPEPERETSHLDKSTVAICGPVSVVTDIAHNWIRSNHDDDDAVFLTPDRVWINHKRMHENSDQEITLIVNMLTENEPLDVTVKGSLRCKGKDYKFRLSYHIEGMDDHQTVYYVTKWSINP